MKPEDLKWPYPWEERRVLMQDRVWHVPVLENDRLDAYSFPGWAHSDFFNNALPVKLEYCSGNGSWIAGKSKAFPDSNWVAVEMKFPRVKKIWSKVKNQQLDNLIAVCGEATDVTSRFIPSSSISELFINFPDPWPKRRHAKYRLIQPAFVSEMSRVLQEGSFLNFVTDSKEYSQWTIEMIGKSRHFVSYYPSPYFLTEDSGYGTSYFDALWREKGRLIYYHKFQLLKHKGMKALRHKEL